METARSEGKFLFPVKAMSKVFTARLVAELRKDFPAEPQSLYDALLKQKWVVYAKQPLQERKKWWNISVVTRIK
jgi:hypothetical protein